MSRTVRVVSKSPSEHIEQVAVIDWAKANLATYPELDMLFAIPNGGKRHIAVAMSLKAEGVKPGAPDLCLPVSRGGYHGCWIEMKRVKGSKVSLEQQEFIAKLILCGHFVRVAKGAEEAVKYLIEYLTKK